MPVLPIGPAPAAGAPRPSFGDALRARLAGPAPAPAGVPLAGTLEALRPRSAAEPGLARRIPGARPPAVPMLAAVEEARARLDAVLAEARRGRTFSAGELLALQAQAYRAAQVLDVASKVVEQGAQSVRQAVSTQV